VDYALFAHQPTPHKIVPLFSPSRRRYRHKELEFTSKAFDVSVNTCFAV